MIALPYAAGELAGANLETGRRVWVAALIGARRTETRGAILDLSGGPVIRDGRVYAANQSGELSAFDLRSGRKIWARPIGMTQPVWPAGDSLFALDANGALLRLSARDGATIWRAALPLWRDSEDREDPIGWSGPVAAGGAVHIVSTLGELLSFDAATGAQTARAEAPSGVAAPPVIAGGTLYLLGMDGRLSAWR